MPDIIRRLADLSIARGCGFASLAVACVMVSLAGNPARVFEAGGFGALLLSLALILKARNARTDNFKRTEVWIMLEKNERPPEALAADWITRARKAALLCWAHRMAWAALAMLSFALLLILTR